MLYVTTRDKRDAYTAYYTLSKEKGPKGGFFIPFQKVKFSADEICALKDKSVCQCIADILNIFFSARLDEWDVQCCIGSYPVKLIPMSHKVMVAETWNNPEWDFARVVRNLRSRIMGNGDLGKDFSNWSWISVRIALLFGIFSELYRLGLVGEARTIDVSVPVMDFSAPMAVWYAREMGLPIGTIIFTCNENSGAWDLLHHGQLQTDAKQIVTSTPKCDMPIPDNLERLIYDALGSTEVAGFVNACTAGTDYTLPEEQRITLSKGMFGAVVSQKRMESVIRNVYRTNTYLLNPYSALAYGGLQDYRTTKIETGPALILTERGPQCDLETVSGAMGIPKQELRERFRTM